MPAETTYSHARANFAALCEETVSTREPIVIHRRGAEDVVLIAADELRGLMETAHLLRSPKNAQRLLNALARARKENLPSESVNALREELEIGEG
jgi:antitoxin YefM